MNHRLYTIIPTFFVWCLLGSLMLYVGFCTPLMTDDYLYVFNYDDELGRTTLISSFSEWWETSKQLFIHMNARLANPLNALLLSLGGGKFAFAVLNTVFFLIITGCFARFFFSHSTWKSLIITAGAYIALTPSIEVTLLWSTGSANYLWPTALLSMLLFPIRRLIEGRHFTPAALFLTCVAGFFCGWMHEAVGAPLAAGIFAAFLFCKRARRLQVFLLNVAVGLGVMPIVLSPAAWNRAAASDAGLAFNLSYSAIGFVTYTLIPTLIVLVTAILLRKQTGSRRHSAAQYPCDILLLGFFGFSCLVSLAVGRVGAGGPGYYYLTLSVVLILLRMLGVIMKSSPFFVKSLTLLAGVAACAFGATELLKAAHYAQHGMEQALNQARSGRQICVIDSRYRNRSISTWLPCDYPYSVWHDFCGKYYGVKPFYTITNEFITDRSIYKVFDDKAPHAPQTAQIDDKIIIRLPQGVFCGSGKLKAVQEDTGKEFVFLPTHSLLSQNWVIARCKGKAIRTFGRDYYQGFHYLVLLTEGSENLTLEIPGLIEATKQNVELEMKL